MTMMTRPVGSMMGASLQMRSQQKPGGGPQLSHNTPEVDVDDDVDDTEVDVDDDIDDAEEHVVVLCP